MEEYLFYEPVYRVIICRQHQYAISPNAVFEHFQIYYKSILLNARKMIEEEVKKLRLVNLTDVDIPYGIVKGLKVHEGVKCNYTGCTELRGTPGSMRKHCQAMHKWKLKQNEIKWIAQKIQTFFEGSNVK